MHLHATRLESIGRENSIGTSFLPRWLEGVSVAVYTLRVWISPDATLRGSQANAIQDSKPLGYSPGAAATFAFVGKLRN